MPLTNEIEKRGFELGKVINRTAIFCRSGSSFSGYMCLAWVKSIPNPNAAAADVDRASASRGTHGKDTMLAHDASTGGAPPTKPVEALSSDDVGLAHILTLVMVAAGRTKARRLVVGTYRMRTFNPR